MDSQSVVGMQNCCATAASANAGQLYRVVANALSGVVENVRGTIIREKQSRIAQQ